MFSICFRVETLGVSFKNRVAELKSCEGEDGSRTAAGTPVASGCATVWGKSARRVKQRAWGTSSSPGAADVEADQPTTAIGSKQTFAGSGSYDADMKEP